MTKEEFWTELDKVWITGDMEQFWKLWYGYPEYVQEHLNEIDRQLDDPTSELFKKHQEWWSNLKPRLVEAFGEDWVKEHCKD